MSTRRLVIKEMNRTHPVRIVEPKDFTCDLGPDIHPEEVFCNPRFSFYCFDKEQNAAIFVEVGDPKAVDSAPFYYQAQADHAVGLVSMPLEVFHKVAEQISDPLKGLILIHSVGRCGSTLISKVLESIPSIHSLSEPDDLTQLVMMRNEGVEVDWIRECVASSVRWRCKPREGSAAEIVAIKTRSEVLVLADLLGALFPDSKHLFLYRDGVSWMRSVFLGFPPERDVYDAELNRQLEMGWSKTIPILSEYIREGTPLNPVQIRILAWITCMEGYLKLHAMGVPICATRYEDLISNTTPILKKIFSHCGIVVDDWSEISDVLGRDSQAGTMFDRGLRSKMNGELTEALVQDVHDMLATRPLLNRADVILPRTLVAS